MENWHLFKQPSTNTTQSRGKLLRVQQQQQKLKHADVLKLDTECVDIGSPVDTKLRRCETVGPSFQLNRVYVNHWVKRRTECSFAGWESPERGERLPYCQLL